MLIDGMEESNKKWRMIRCSGGVRRRQSKWERPVAMMERMREEGRMRKRNERVVVQNEGEKEGV